MVLAVAQGGQPGLHPDYVQHKAHVCGKARDLGKDGGCKGQLAVVIKALRNTRTLVEDQVESDTPRVHGGLNLLAPVGDGSGRGATV